MDSAFIGAGFVATLLLATLAMLTWKLLSSMSAGGVDPEWLKGFSIAAYRPMERLLEEDDIRFLRSQPGFEPGMEKTLRANRRRIFRMFLRNLGRDFNRLHYALRLMALYAPQDEPELAKTLVIQKVTFFLALIAVYFRLELYALGLGAVDVRDLISTVDSMRENVHRLMSAPRHSMAAA